MNDRELLACRLQSDARCCEYRPELLRCIHGSDRNRLTEIVNNRATITVFDSLDLQLRDLLKTRNPSQKLDEPTLCGLVRTHLDGQSLFEHGVWVWYPWSRRLIHTLNEADFVELRTNRNQFKITPDEQQRLSTRKVGIVGLSVGHAIALNIALERSAGELRLADFDELELSNLNRVRSGLHGLYESKVVNTAREIAEIDPFFCVTCFPEGLHKGNYDSFLEGAAPLDLVIDECDSFDVKCSLRSECRQRRIPVMMATSDRGLLDIERFDLEPDRPIFHGLAGDLDAAQLAGLTTEEKIPYVMQILGQESLSKRLRASMIEIDQQIKTWPQLASAVAQGAAMVGDVVRRLGLGADIPSGRYFDDLEDLLKQPANVSLATDLANDHSTTSRMNHVPSEKSATELINRSQFIRSDYGDPDLVRVHELVRDAILAPSAANAQPWKWYWSGRDLTLCLDTQRTSDALDFENTGSLVSLGAAAENLLISAHAKGLRPRLERFPDNSRPNSVARFRLNDSSSHVEEAWCPELHAVLGVRHTNRRVGPRRIIPAAILDALGAAVSSIPGARVQWITEEESLKELGSLLGATDRLRNLNPNFHAELVRELRWTAEEVAATRDGIDVRSLELSASDFAGMRISCDPETIGLVRAWNGGKNFEKMTAKAVRCASAMGLITMPSCQRSDFFQGGRSVQRCWLTATKNQLAFWPMTALPYFFARLLRGSDKLLSTAEKQELVELRQRYTRLFDVSDNQGEILLFRLGFGESTTAHSLRRSLDDVFEIQLVE